MQDLYISHKAAGDIERALHDATDERIKLIAEDLFNGDVKPVSDLLEVFKTDWGESFLTEVCFWGSQAEDLLNMWRTSENMYDRFEKYANESGYFIQWMAYNEKHGLPIPDYDKDTWEDLTDGEEEST